MNNLVRVSSKMEKREEETAGADFRVSFLSAGRQSARKDFEKE